ncbi:hypothetical protein CP976_32010 [Streptomyces coeruleorubidus]|uniref:Uncharacterized protein n=1 Tax=Streptomyces coeruleorubidus TaxID=116188 RepID=A0A5J6IAB8_STRC4|nr:hypothetical protein CP976_32010 [Streptomyces coeruleorubidus]
MPPQDTSRGNHDEVNDCQQHSRADVGWGTQDSSLRRLGAMVSAGIALAASAAGAMAARWLTYHALRARITRSC